MASTIAAVAVFFTAGCESTPEAPVAPVATAIPPQTMSSITFRVTGNARGITGSYTDATGADVAIPLSVAATADAPAYAAVPWETTVQMPIEIMRRQHINLAADDAFGSGADITAEILVDGKVVNTITGPQPSLFIQKH